MPAVEDFPESAPFAIAGRTWSPDEIIGALGPFLTERRQERIREVVAARTRTVVPVIEGLYNMGNVSAVLRSAEALGYQAVHVVEPEKTFENSSRTAAGTRRWLDVHRWTERSACFDALGEHGYRLLVAHVEEAEPIESVDFTRPTAVLFGNEADGVSEEALDRADGRIRVPMVGFVESFNISVAAAVTLYRAYRDRLDRRGSHGDLSEEERRYLEARCYLESVRRPEPILRRAAREREESDERDRA